MMDRIIIIIHFFWYLNAGYELFLAIKVETFCIAVSLINADFV